MAAKAAIKCVSKWDKGPCLPIESLDVGESQSLCPDCAEPLPTVSLQAPDFEGCYYLGHLKQTG